MPTGTTRSRLHWPAQGHISKGAIMQLAERGIAATEDEYRIPLYHKRDIALVRGEGPYLWDADGTRYLDMMSNYGVAILGHSHPGVTAAIVEQAGRLVSCHQSFYND